MKHSISQPSLLSPTRSPDAFVWWRSLIFAVLLVIALMGGAIAAGILIGAVYGFDALKHPTARMAVIAQVGAYIIPVFLLLFMLPWVAKRSLRDLGLVPLSWRVLGWGIAGAVGMTVIVFLLSWTEEHVLHVKVDQSAVEILKRANRVDGYLFAAMALVLAPFVEELTFRGFLFNAIARYAPVWLAVVLSGCCFGLVHWEANNPWAVIPLAGAGIVLALIYTRARALTSTMIAHGLFNALTVVAILAGVK